MTWYKLAVTVTYDGIVTVEADSLEEAEEYISDEIPSWLSIDDTEIDFFESVISQDDC